MKNLIILFLSVFIWSCSGQVNLVSSQRIKIIPGVSSANTHTIYKINYKIKEGEKMDLMEVFLELNDKKYPVEFTMNLSESIEEKHFLFYRVEVSLKNTELENLKEDQNPMVNLVFEKEGEQKVVTVTSFEEKTERRR
jgi:hypothetical protein